MTIQQDTIVTLIGVMAGIALGVQGIYEKIEENRHKNIIDRLEQEELNHNITRRLLKKYQDKYGELKDVN